MSNSSNTENLHESIWAIREQAEMLSQEAARLNQVADNLEGGSSAFFESANSPTAAPPLAGPISQDNPSLAATARAVIQYRQRRVEHFPAELFGEPAWNMLLDLFLSDTEGGPVSVSSLCIASRAAQTTALRYVQMLLSHGLAERYDSNQDGRVSYVRLSAHGERAMRGYLTQSQPIIKVCETKAAAASG